MTCMNCMNTTSTCTLNTFSEEGIGSRVSVSQILVCLLLRAFLHMMNGTKGHGKEDMHAMAITLEGCLLEKGASPGLGGTYLIRDMSIVLKKNEITWPRIQCHGSREHSSRTAAI